MKTLNIQQCIEIKSILLDLPIRYDDEDIPFDFPCRVAGSNLNSDNYDRLKLLIDINTGEILTPEFPKDFKYKIDTMKVCDEGIYILYGNQDQEIARHECYVPRCVPNEYGDYVNLDIENGFITNWSAGDDFEEFEQQ